jgi:hypothetical protein
MDKAMLELYSDYLISSFWATIATGLSELLNGEVSHDQSTKSLAKKKAGSKELWQIAKPTWIGMIATVVCGMTFACDRRASQARSIAV